MKRPAVASVTFSALLLSGVALAQGAPAADAASADSAAAPAAEAPAAAPTDVKAEPGKFVLGLRLGYALPMGDAAKGRSMGDVYSGMIPIGIDAGYMVTPNIMAGVYFQYGLVSVADKTCPSGLDCSASNLRFGIQGQYHLSPANTLDPWFGLGIGYESMSMTMKMAGVSADSSAKGFEFVNLQAGLDYRLSPAFGVGPFLSFSLAQYSSFDVPSGVEKPESAMHQWLTLGVRGSFNL